MTFNLGFQTKYILNPWCMLFHPVKVLLKVISISFKSHSAMLWVSSHWILGAKVDGFIYLLILFLWEMQEKMTNPQKCNSNKKCTSLIPNKITYLNKITYFHTSNFDKVSYKLVKKGWIFYYKLIFFVTVSRLILHSKNFS